MKKNNILFVTEESINGVFTVINSLIENWGGKDEIFLMSNKLHWAKSDLLKMGKNYTLLKSPFYSPIDLYKLSKFRGLALNILKLTVKILSPIYVIFCVYKLNKILKKNKIDVIYSHNGGLPGGFLPRVILYSAKILNIKNTFTVIHNYPVKPKIKIYSFIRNILISKSCNKIISVSHAVAQSLIKETNLRKDIEVIHNGLPIIDYIPNNLKKDFKWMNKSNLILFLGEITHRKGLHILIDSLKDIQFDYNLVIFGSGEDKYTNYCKEKIKKNNMTKKVYFEGFDKNAKFYIKYFDILVLPSLYGESLPMVILEAFKNKTPVISTKVGGISEIIENEKNGLLINPNNKNELANSIIKLLKDQEHRKMLGEKSFEYFNEHLLITKCVNKYKALIDY